MSLYACFAGSGDSSTEREFFAGLRGPTVSTPNSQHSSPSRSVSGPYSSYRLLYLGIACSVHVCEEFILLPVQQIPSKWNFTAMKKQVVPHLQREEQEEEERGTKDGSRIRWTSSRRLAERLEETWVEACSAREGAVHPDPFGSLTGNWSVTYVGWSASALMFWWYTNAAIQVGFMWLFKSTDSRYSVLKKI